MRRSLYLLLLPVVGLLFISGCNGGVTNPQTPLNPGSLTADFPDGSGFISSGARATDESGDYLIIATVDVSGQPADEITMTIPKNSALPFTVQSQPDNAIVTYYDAVTGVQYEANAAQGYCTITVTQTSPTLEGSFSARTICSTISDSIRTLTNGAFNGSYQ